MTRVIFEGPMPPPGKDFCTVCMLLYKSEVVHASAEQIRVYDTDKLDAVAVFDMKKHEPETATRPFLAIGIGPVQGNLHLGLVKLCWTHLLAQPKEMPSGVAVSHTQDVDQAAAQAGVGLLPAVKGQMR
jgi:hypothetical protein